MMTDRPYQKFNIIGWMGVHHEALIEIRCWVCGTCGRFGDRDATGLEELTGWAEAHECARSLRANLLYELKAEETSNENADPKPTDVTITS